MKHYLFFVFGLLLCLASQGQSDTVVSDLVQSNSYSDSQNAFGNRLFVNFWENPGLTGANKGYNFNLIYESTQINANGPVTYLLMLRSLKPLF